jgi:hypothetical protein
MAVLIEELGFHNLGHQVALDCLVFLVLLTFYSAIASLGWWFRHTLEEDGG